MSVIQILSPQLADLIAAGEVVERPASVVKELTENAIDAGCSAVTVEIQHGGMTLVRVTDDGCGIAYDDVPTAFLRHATSKLRCEQDLEAIGTLGFRGEALAAIAAVSRVEMLTRVHGAVRGAALTIEGGRVLSLEEAGCPDGTTMLVRGLFFNTPARLKFMKKDAAEGAAVFAVVQRLALSHPEVSVKFIRDGKQELLTPGDGTLKSAVYSVLGRDIALGLAPVRGEGDLAVEGFVSLPACCRGSRGYQHFFVNGRQIRSRTMTVALEEAYKNQKMVGRFPACVLHLSAKLSTVDVNVHPTKTEVKFVSDQKVFDAVYYAVLAALGGGRAAAVAAQAPSAAAEHHTGGTGILRAGSAPPPVFPSRAAPALREVDVSGPRADYTPAPPGRKEEAPATDPAPAISSTPTVSSVPAPSALSACESLPSPGPARASAPSPEPGPVPMVDQAPWRVVGEAMQTYIIVEQEGKLLLIDKHAAHERMEFDRLKDEGYTPMRQRLLAPLALTLPPMDGAALLEQLPLLERFGFEAEPFGGGAILIREAPADIPAGMIESAVTQLAEALRTAGRADPDSARDAVLRTMACKAAIKGGQKNAPAELERVAAAVIRGEVRYCPHGRPVMVELTRARLEKEFKRT